MMGSISLEVTLASREITAVPAGTEIGGRGLPPRGGSRFGERISLGVPVNWGLGSSILRVSLPASCAFDITAAQITADISIIVLIFILLSFFLAFIQGHYFIFAFYYLRTSDLFSIHQDAQIEYVLRYGPHEPYAPYVKSSLQKLFTA
jgi:hypothetical protein